MSRLGVDREIAELAIGHKRTGLDGLYNFDGLVSVMATAMIRAIMSSGWLMRVRAEVSVP
jgi:hypothetical protein